MQKRQLRFKIGSRGSGPGYFTWPRGIAVGPDNSIVVADSSNHRVQVSKLKQKKIRIVVNIFNLWQNFRFLIKMENL